MFAPTAAWAQAFEPAYGVELSQGTLVAPSRIVGMGGAFVSIAEGAGAYEINPAAAAIRYPHNKDELWDWDFALEGIVSPRDSADFENSRREASRVDNLAAAYASLGFVAEHFGMGVAISASSLQVKTEGQDPITLTGGTLSLVGGYNLMQGQLVLGLGVALGSTNADRAAQLEFFGIGLVAGGVAQPKGQPYRFGFTLKTRTTMSAQEGTVPGMRTADLLVPTSFVVPAQLTVGMSYSFGSRANNVTKTFGTREAEKDDALPKERDFVTVAADVVFTEALERVAGFQAWADDVLQPAGQAVTVGLHIGAESEIIDNRLKLRAGGYYEPSRFAGSGRFHGTTGFDLRLFELIWDWKFAFAGDFAKRYTNLIFSIGFWH
ncbi:MAG: hypothetical protein RMA76_26700 [Deltaproteobacteria bacterium]|jgi:hypothetical protein